MSADRELATAPPGLGMWQVEQPGAAVTRPVGRIPADSAVHQRDVPLHAGHVVLVARGAAWSLPTPPWSLPALVMWWQGHRQATLRVGFRIFTDGEPVALGWYHVASVLLDQPDLPDYGRALHLHATQPVKTTGRGASW